jgi:hypothetical protein
LSVCRSSAEDEVALLKKLIVIAVVSGIIATAMRRGLRGGRVRPADPGPAGDDVQRWENEGGAVTHGETRASAGL